MSLAARTHIKRGYSSDYYHPTAAPLARARSRVHTRRAQIHVVAGLARVLGSTLSAHLSRRLTRAHAVTSAPASSASALLCLIAQLRLCLLYSYIWTRASPLRAFLPTLATLTYQ
jgi:hypothetical protein